MTTTFSPGPTPNTVRAADGKVLTVPDGWILVPPGDAALTRRIKAAGDHYAVAEKKGGSKKGLVIGGKSMGGRIASMVADEAGVRGLVCLGYPFHPTGRPERLRTAHLEGLTTPALFVQGTRDPFGTREDVAGYALSPAIRLHWLEDGDHSFKPRKASGYSEAEHLASAADAVAEFIRGL